MKIGKIKFIIMLSALFLLTATAWAQMTMFTYQGKLTDTGNPPTETYQMEFSLFDAVAGGTQIGKTIENNSVSVKQGIFTVNLDFGAAVFSGEDRFLQIAVRRNSGESFVMLNPRQQITSSPYSIRTLSAAQADLALDSERLGGVDASEYVTNATVGSSFIRNATTLQTGNFNINGNGFVGGNFGIGTTAPLSKLSVRTGTFNPYGLTHTNGTVTLGTFIDNTGGWLGTQSNHPLYFFTNNGLPQTTLLQSGEFGIGVTPQLGLKLDVGGNARFQTFNGNINFGSPNGETGMTFTNANRADIRFDASGLKLLANSGTGIPAATSGIFINNAGNVGIGTTAPTTKLQVESGGIFSTFLRVSNTGFGGNAIVATTSDISGNALLGTGNIFTSGNIKQNLTSNGVVKAMAYIEYGGTQIPTIVRCYDGVNNSTAEDCGFLYGPVTLFGGQTVTRITFTFTVNNRFISVTPSGFAPQASVNGFPDAQRVDILNNYSDFFIFVY